MPQLLAVQMNVQGSQKIQPGQSGPTSPQGSIQDYDNNFNSVLNKALPAENIGTNNSAVPHASEQINPDTLANTQSETVENSQHFSPNSYLELASQLTENPGQTDPKEMVQATLDGENLPPTEGIQRELNVPSLPPETLSSEQRPGNEGEQINFGFGTKNLRELQNNISTVEQVSGAVETDNRFGTKDFSGLQNNISTQEQVSAAVQTDYAFRTKDFSGLQNNISGQEQVSGAEQTNFGFRTKELGELQNRISQPAGIQSGTTETAGTFLPTKEPIKINPQQEALLQRIQNIVNNGNEVGTVSIKTNTAPEQATTLRTQLATLTTVPQNLEPIQASATSGVGKEGAFTALEEGVFAPALRSQQQLTSVRHDVNQQFYDAKTHPQIPVSDASNSATNQQDGNLTQQGSGFNQPSPLMSHAEGNNIFTLPVDAVSDPTSLQTTESAKSITLPSGTVVQDQQVLQQLVERFQVNRRQLESKIQLKLHPAELGGMEINLTVKEGSIRANVIAQSQHVQEILERNIAKLRSTLEQQGFNIEEISITTEAETVGSFDLFDQQLPNKDTSQFASQIKNTTTDPLFSIEENEESFSDENSGVNVEA